MKKFILGFSLPVLFVFLIAATGSYNRFNLFVRNIAAFGTNTGTARVTIKSDGTNDALSVQNSSGTEVFDVDNSGALSSASYSTTGAITAASIAVTGLASADRVKTLGETADPCSTFGVGAMFYNSTSNYWCFCDGNTDDIKMNDNNTACFGGA